MIESKNGRTRIEGNSKEILNEWANITGFVYYEIAKLMGLKEASKIFSATLLFVANQEANELREKGELPDE